MNSAQKDSRKKTDRRILYTKKVIKDAYIQLLKTKPENKITITEICNIAEINRGTFYRHFEDINAVKETIEDELFQKFQKYVESQKPNVKNREFLSDHFQDLILHDETFIAFLNSIGLPRLYFNLMKAFYKDYFKAALPEDHNLNERELELLYMFVVGGVMAVEQDWIHNNQNIKKENRFLEKMVQRLISVNVKRRK